MDGMDGMGCFVYRLNAVEDHLHVLVDIGPEMSPAKFVRVLKTSSNKWIKGSSYFPRFTAWQEGYGAFTKSWAEKDTVIEYIRNQEEHHRTVSFVEEFRRLVEEAGLVWDDRFLP